MNNHFPHLSLTDFAKIRLVIAMQGEGQYALLLVHEHEVLIEGRPCKCKHKGKGLRKGLFKAIATQVEWVVSQKEQLGEIWVGT
jgi:hypothetical protein